MLRLTDRVTPASVEDLLLSLYGTTLAAALLMPERTAEVAEKLVTFFGAVYRDSAALLQRNHVQHPVRNCVSFRQTDLLNNLRGFSEAAMQALYSTKGTSLGTFLWMHALLTLEPDYDEWLNDGVIDVAKFALRRGRTVPTEIRERKVPLLGPALSVNAQRRMWVGIGAPSAIDGMRAVAKGDRTVDPANIRSRVLTWLGLDVRLGGQDEPVQGAGGTTYRNIHDPSIVPPPIPRAKAMPLVPGRVVASSGDIAKDAFVGFDQTGRPVWRYLFERPLKTKYEGTLDRHRRIWEAVDLDGDGIKECILFIQDPLDHESMDHALWCFWATGEVRWRLTAGKTVRTAKEEFPPPYTILQFAAGRLGGQNTMSIAVSAGHHQHRPTQIVVLSPDGDIRGVYWHSGHLYQLEIGWGLMYLGGANNARNGATLIVLDVDRMGGASVEPSAESQLLGFAPGREEARLVFARTCINPRFRDFNTLEALWVHPDRVVAHVNEDPFHAPSPTIIYTFTPGLALKAVAPSSLVWTVHENLERQGLIEHQANIAEETARLWNIEYVVPANRLETAIREAQHRDA